MTEKAQVAEALKAPRTPSPEEDEKPSDPAAATTDEVPFDPLAALIGSEGVALDGSAFEAAADQPMDDLDFDPRVSPHAYEAAPASVGIIIVDHGSKVAAANERLGALPAANPSPSGDAAGSDASLERDSEADSADDGATQFRINLGFWSWAVVCLPTAPLSSKSPSS